MAEYVPWPWDSRSSKDLGLPRWLAEKNNLMQGELRFWSYSLWIRFFIDFSGSRLRPKVGILGCLRGELFPLMCFLKKDPYTDTLWCFHYCISVDMLGGHDSTSRKIVTARNAVVNCFPGTNAGIKNKLLNEHQWKVGSSRCGSTRAKQFAG